LRAGSTPDGSLSESMSDGSDATDPPRDSGVSPGGLWLPASVKPATDPPKRRLSGPRAVISSAFSQNYFGEQVSSALSAATLWIRKKRDARFEPRKDVASAILDRIAVEGAAKQSALKVAVIVAHPDDEAIGAGAVLKGLSNATIVHVTDGAPADEGYALKKGFPSREAYALARRQEVIVSLGVIGISSERIRGLGFIDGEASWHLVELCHKVMNVMEELRPDVVLTHPYEGGHSDHDSTAFAVHLAAGILLREGSAAPIILELTSYHNYNGTRRLFDFLPFQDTEVKTVRLSEEARRTKRQMFDAFTSQQAVLRSFPIEVERFRQAPRYLFTVPPHQGELDYERLCKRMTGAQWRAEAERALRMLRAKRQFTGGVPERAD
jgi:N-acetylglucosamine malate deacetylase 2